jgi:hypothetical protein
MMSDFCQIFSQKTYWDAATLSVKCAAFYFAILAALVGYVVTQRLPGRVGDLALVIGLVTSGLTVVVAFIAVRTMYRCLNLLERLMIKETGAVIDGSEIRILFSRWRCTVWAFSLGGLALTGMFIAGILVLLGALGTAK